MFIVSVTPVNEVVLMTFDISPAQLFLFVDICLLIAVSGMYFTFLKHERRNMHDVLKSNETLARSVSSLVRTMDAALEQNIIEKAVTQRVKDRDMEMEEFTIE